MGGDWRLRRRFFTLETRWFALYGEHLETQHGESLAYWRVQRADSAIVLPVRDGELIVPAPIYRPGVGQSTLDFPGGRIDPALTPALAARAVLMRELGLEDGAVVSIQALNTEGWPVDSSFSDQRLYGFVATLRPQAEPTAQHLCFDAGAEGVAALESRLVCLQCRAVLREWQLRDGTAA